MNDANLCQMSEDLRRSDTNRYEVSLSLSDSDNPTVWARWLALLWVSVAPKKTKTHLLSKMWEIDKL